MTKPLALLLHDKPMPGSRLVARFEEMGYRVSTVADPGRLMATAKEALPMLVVADLTNGRGDVLAAVEGLRGDAATAHLPVIAYAAKEDGNQREAALRAGVQVVATDATIVQHLGPFVDQALQLD